MHKVKAEIDRFSTKIKKTESCWEWVGSKYRNGYGHFRRKLNGNWIMYKAHRYSYEYFNNTTLENQLVLHKCDNPSCVNPDHLFLGTAYDNYWDMREKNRWKMIRNPNHNLLSYDVAQQIRQYKERFPNLSGRDLASLFHTSPAQISRILSNKIWQKEN